MIFEQNQNKFPEQNFGKNKILGKKFWKKILIFFCKIKIWKKFLEKKYLIFF